MTRLLWLLALACVVIAVFAAALIALALVRAKRDGIDAHEDDWLIDGRGAWR